MTLEEVERETHGVRKQHKEPFPDKRRAVVCSVYTFGYYCKLQCTTGNSNRNVRGIFPSSSCSVMSQPAVRLDHILVTLGLISTTTKIPWISRGEKYNNNCHPSKWDWHHPYFQVFFSFIHNVVFDQIRKLFTAAEATTTTSSSIIQGDSDVNFRQGFHLLQSVSIIDNDRNWEELTTMLTNQRKPNVNKLLSVCLHLAVVLVSRAAAQANR